MDREYQDFLRKQKRIELASDVIGVLCIIGLIVIVMFGIAGGWKW